MKKERTTLPLASLELNTGQIEWLPRNPRQWTADDVNKTAKSIAEDEDFLEDRPILVVPNGKKFVVFAGNLRSEGAKKQKLKDAPCVVYHPETEADQQAVIRRAGKDNGSFGQFDWDILANEWDYPLQDWGINAWQAPSADHTPGSRAADHDDVHQGEFEYAVKVVVGTMDEQLALLSEMEERGYSASVI